MRIAYSMIEEQDTGESRADFYILGDITSTAWEPGDGTPQEVAEKLKELEGWDITVHINSYGGETSAGIAIYNLLKNHDGKVKTVCEGFACSAASLIFLAGSERVMRTSSLLMIHNAWTVAQGNAAELEKAADDLRKISDTAANIYRENSALTEEDLQSLLEEETWITPEEALRYGMATEIDGGNTQTGQTYSSAFLAISAALRDTGKGEPAPEQKPVKTPFQRLFGKTIKH